MLWSFRRALERQIDAKYPDVWSYTGFEPSEYLERFYPEAMDLREVYWDAADASVDSKQREGRQCVSMEQLADITLEEELLSFSELLPPSQQIEDLRDIAARAVELLEQVQAGEVPKYINLEIETMLLKQEI